MAPQRSYRVLMMSVLAAVAFAFELDDHGGDLTGRVERTLLVGDEPRDLVFAGPGITIRMRHRLPGSAGVPPALPKLGPPCPNQFCDRP